MAGRRQVGTSTKVTEHHPQKPYWALLQPCLQGSSRPEALCVKESSRTKVRDCGLFCQSRMMPARLSARPGTDRRETYPNGIDCASQNIACPRHLAASCTEFRTPSERSKPHSNSVPASTQAWRVVKKA